MLSFLYRVGLALRTNLAATVRLPRGRGTTASRPFAEQRRITTTPNTEDAAKPRPYLKAPEATPYPLVP